MKYPKVVLRVFLTLLFSLAVSNTVHAKYQRIALITNIQAAPSIQCMSNCLHAPSVLSHNIVEKEFRKLLKKKEKIELETDHHVSLVDLYQVLQRPDLDAVFFFGHMGGFDDHKKIFPNHTFLKDLQPSFQGLRAQTKFIGLCGCNSALFLKNIKKIAPHVVAYGLQHKVRGKWQKPLKALFKAWHTQIDAPERAINNALDTSNQLETKKHTITVTFTRECNDPSVDYYDELLVFDIKQKCIGYFLETKPQNIPQSFSVNLELPQLETGQSHRDRNFNFTCKSGYRLVKLVGRRRIVLGIVDVNSEALNGTWLTMPSVTSIFLKYHS